jgi:O-antigen/teichoic acid export membrane protein
MESDNKVLDALSVPLKLKNRIQAGYSFLSTVFLGKGIVALADQGVVSAANFSTGLIIGRICSKEQLGLYMLGFTIIMFIMNVQSCLISTPYTIYSPHLQGVDLNRYTGSTLLHQLVLSFLIIIILAITGAALSLGFGPPGLAPVVKTLMFVSSFILLWDYARRLCFATLKMKNALLLDSCVLVLQVGLLLILGKLGYLSAARAYWVVGTACGVVTLSWLLLNKKNFKLSLEQAITDLLQNLSTGLWIFGSGLVFSASNYLYPWLLAAFHGAALTAVWAVCLGVVGLCNPLFIGLQNSFTPQIAHVYAKGKVDALRRFALHTITIMGLTILPFCLLLLVFGGPLVSGLYGTKYAGNGLIVSILAANLLISSLGFAPARALFTVERADVEFGIAIVSLVLLFSCGILLVKRFGPAGAAAGLLLSNSAYLVLLLAAFSRIVRSRESCRRRS